MSDMTLNVTSAILYLLPCNVQSLINNPFHCGCTPENIQRKFSYSSSVPYSHVVVFVAMDASASVKEYCAALAWVTAFAAILDAFCASILASCSFCLAFIS